MKPPAPPTPSGPGTTQRQPVIRISLLSLPDDAHARNLLASLLEATLRDDVGVKAEPAPDEVRGFGVTYDNFNNACRSLRATGARVEISTNDVFLGGQMPPDAPPTSIPGSEDWQ